MRGNLYIVSAPSGSGKTTLLQHLLRSFKDLKFSVSHTTGQPRQGERDGVDYYFTDRDGVLPAWRIEESFWNGRNSMVSFTVRRAHLSKKQISSGQGRDPRHRRPGRETGEGENSGCDGDFRTAAFVSRARSGGSRRGCSSPTTSFGAGLKSRRDEIRFYCDYDYIIINDVLENSIRLLESIVRSGTAVLCGSKSRIEEIIASFGGLA